MMYRPGSFDVKSLGSWNAGDLSMRNSAAKQLYGSLNHAVLTRIEYDCPASDDGISSPDHSQMLGTGTCEDRQDPCVSRDKERQQPTHEKPINHIFHAICCYMYYWGKQRTRRFFHSSPC